MRTFDITIRIETNEPMDKVLYTIEGLIAGVYDPWNHTAFMEITRKPVNIKSQGVVGFKIVEGGAECKVNDSP